jgi:hypothetical protein
MLAAACSRRHAAHLTCQPCAYHVAAIPPYTCSGMRTCARSPSSSCGKTSKTAAGDNCIAFNLACILQGFCNSLEHHAMCSHKWRSWLGQCSWLGQWYGVGNVSNSHSCLCVGRFVMGSTKMLSVALGKEESEELRPNLSKLSARIRGMVCDACARVVIACLPGTDCAALRLPCACVCWAAGGPVVYTPVSPRGAASGGGGVWA